MTSTDTKNGTTPIAAALAQVQDLSEQVLATARTAGNQYLDSYEKAADRAVELERRVAGLTQQEWLRNVLNAQADFAHELSSSFTSTARELLK
jgi:hypothetical protein